MTLPAIKRASSACLGINGDLWDEKSIGYLVTLNFAESICGKGVQFDVEFHVVPGFGPGLCIGVDMMNTYRLDTLVPQHCAYLRPLKLEFKIWFNRCTQSHMKVCCKADVVIPPRSHKIDYSSITTTTISIYIIVRKLSCGRCGFEVFHEINDWKIVHGQKVTCNVQELSRFLTLLPIVVNCEPIVLTLCFAVHVNNGCNAPVGDSEGL